MLWSVYHGPSLISISVSNFSHFRHLHQNRIHDGCHGGYLKRLVVICSRTISRMKRKLGGGQQGDLELLKWFRSDIQDGHHGSHLELLQIISAPKR